MSLAARGHEKLAAIDGAPAWEDGSPVLVTRELGPLRMENASSHTVIATGKPGPEGHDDVGFCARINPGAPSGRTAVAVAGVDRAGRPW